MSFSSDNPMLANQVPISQDTPDPKDPNFRNIMSVFLKRVADSINTKEGALYLPQELATFQQYFSYTPSSGVRNAFNTRNVYRKVIDCGALPNNSTKTVLHGIAFDSQCTLTRLYGAATDPTGLVYVPVPYVDAIAPGVGEVGLSLDATNVIITTRVNRSSYTRCTVVIEWTKNL